MHDQHRRAEWLQHITHIVGEGLGLTRGFRPRKQKNSEESFAMNSLRKASLWRSLWRLSSGLRVKPVYASIVWRSARSAAATCACSGTYRFGMQVCVGSIFRQGGGE